MAVMLHYLKLIPDSGNLTIYFIKTIYDHKFVMFYTFVTYPVKTRRLINTPAI